MKIKVSLTVSILAYYEEPPILSSRVDYIEKFLNAFLSCLCEDSRVEVDFYTGRSHEIDFHEDTNYTYLLSFYIYSSNVDGFYHLRTLLESIHSFLVYLCDEVKISPLMFDPNLESLLISPPEYE